MLLAMALRQTGRAEDVSSLGIAQALRRRLQGPKRVGGALLH